MSRRGAFAVLLSLTLTGVAVAPRPVWRVAGGPVLAAAQASGIDRIACSSGAVCRRLVGACHLAHGPRDLRRLGQDRQRERRGDGQRRHGPGRQGLRHFARWSESVSEVRQRAAGDVDPRPHRHDAAGAQHAPDDFDDGRSVRDGRYGHQGWRGGPAGGQAGRGGGAGGSGRWSRARGATAGRSRHRPHADDVGAPRQRPRGSEAATHRVGPRESAWLRPQLDSACGPHDRSARPEDRRLDDGHHLQCRRHQRAEPAALRRNLPRRHDRDVPR